MKGMAGRIRYIRKTVLHLNQAQFAARIGVSQPTVSRWEKGEDEPDDVNLGKIAVQGKRTMAWIRYGKETVVSGKLTVPVVGYVRAGERAEAPPDVEKPEHVELPPDMAAEDLVALIVRGSSMRPFLRDGWKLYYRRRDSGVPAECINELCVVGLEDGQTLVKVVRPGTTANRYTLLSLSGTEEPLDDQALAWASVVEAMTRP